ncbi:GNAT family N-acetyltransferase [Pontibacter anaerobius]|uniref:GNAT family N-acetyltransferase n=1 Tax=Pontibacter anaerobius TaxID=2993940 RepID=A0ABT3RL27_9BACT|nr:GNAT family N-acetyltransferase [Pontibacter anaerobius]MCX2742203.1 GNAT family N-acetyltransferase [Pontibacter anaerobius]
MKKLLDEEFLLSWKELYEKCPWATIFQSSEYVLTWYKVYHHEFPPILVIATSRGKLTGLLALNVAKNKIVGAGHFDAEYQTWLSEEVSADAFIKQALTEVCKLYPRHQIELKYVPGNASIKWAKDPQWKHKCVIGVRKSPIMNIKNEGFKLLFKKKDYKVKNSRLNRMGNFRFELITDKNNFATIYDLIATQWDFRQAARYNKNHFDVSDKRRNLKLSLFDKKLLHVSALMLDSKVLATCEAVISPDQICLKGMKSYDPTYANYSLGFVHFLKLGLQMEREGIDLLDLTPGDDPYKDILATDYNQVYELTVTSSTLGYIKSMFRKRVYLFLTRRNINPLTLKLSLIKKLYLLKERFRVMRELGPVQLAKSLLPRSAGKQQETYQLWPATSPPPAPEGIRRDSLDDLLLYRPARAQVSRWEFLEEAMVRFETRQHSYTLAEEGRLLLCVWLGAPGAGPEEAALQDLYCHPDGAGMLQAFLGAVAGEVAATQKCRRVTISADPASNFLSHKLKRTNFMDRRDFEVRGLTTLELTNKTSGSKQH